MNNKGQFGMGFIFGIVMLVVAVLLITSFWPTVQDSFDALRGNETLNCKSDDVCGVVPAGVPCYNPTQGNEHPTTCAMVSIGPPLILIMLILGVVALISGAGRQSQPAYPQY